MRIKFPHFTPDEAEVLREFIAQKVLVGDWSFDVRLKSEKAELAAEYPPEIRSMWEAVTAKRIDAVCETTDAVNIIEVKKYMLHSGIGQLLTYRELYREQYKPTKPIVLWLIAKYPDPEVLRVCERLGIRTWVMEK